MLSTVVGYRKTHLREDSAGAFSGGVKGGNKPFGGEGKEGKKERQNLNRGPRGTIKKGGVYPFGEAEAMASYH